MRLLIASVLALAAVSAPVRAETIQIIIDKLVFIPAEVEAKVGDTIEWVNKDPIVHTATVKGGWDVNIPARKTGSLVIEKAESVEYYCRFHPNMKGRVTSTAP
jgi:plastocyanin